MYPIINLITNALSFSNSKKVQSIIFLVLLFNAIGIFVLVTSVIHHSLFSYFYLALIIILSILLIFFAVFYIKTDDRILILAEKLSIDNFRPTEVENRCVINEQLKGISISFHASHNSENLTTYSYEAKNDIREEDLFKPNRNLNSRQKAILKKYYSKLEQYVIGDEKMTSEVFAQLFCDEKDLSSTDKIKFKEEISLIDIGDVLNELNKSTKIHKNQIVKLFSKFNRKSRQYEDINLRAVNAAMSRYNKILRQ